MTNNELYNHIVNFVKLNPRREKYPNVTNKRIESYLIVQEYFKTHNKDIKTSDYDNIFYNKNTSLNGKEWINILLSTKNYKKYYKTIKVGYLYCNQRVLKQKLLLELFYWKNCDKQEALIEIAQTDFSQEQKNQLKQLRSFLNDQDWSNFFFNLQKLMHQEIISFLDWNNKPLNYKDYSKVLTKKLTNSLNDLKLVENYNQIIQLINSYRNNFSKASTLNSEIILEWNSKNDLTKEILAWKLYYSLIELISSFNLILDKKGI